MNKDFLQGILNDIKGYAKQTIPGAMGMTSSQGKALLGMADITGGMQREAMSNDAAMARAQLGETSAMERQKVAEAGLGLRLGTSERGATGRQNSAQSSAMEKLKLSETGDTARAKLTAEGTFARAGLSPKTTSASDGGGLTGGGLTSPTAKPIASEPASGSGNWWDTYVPATGGRGEAPSGDNSNPLYNDIMSENKGGWDFNSF